MHSCLLTLLMTKHYSSCSATGSDSSITVYMRFTFVFYQIPHGHCQIDILEQFPNNGLISPRSVYADIKTLDQCRGLCRREAGYFCRWESRNIMLLFMNNTISVLVLIFIH